MNKSNKLISGKIDKAYQRYEQGLFISKSKEEFLEEIRRW